ncbi:2-C-methyl-D-erythritol 2,4-cyclodiphosphate synthase [Sphingobacterium hungaricum]|uniref:2-C-methyl-D-erythritol 2,4-cyclodiphosphate synthase n=1 Tax=Sphingobacterium hungaricum TaxID=2082723 RepID=A0A928UXC1_9SPHI|nr:2-C-methyl-D-erythritol 2,4-cyclodiphosphate synthase [Sphingobacterium hungaricum]MBE8713703.1 2-C-methyl-D-erythritol 2,4-cyclodiphosphate synthase [Sphingobacterium hungaricum]
MKIKVGFGFDVHQLKEGHPFVLGGVTLDHHAGAFGHSDADVLAHAICDAILGATNLEDIGYHFPNTDDRWKGANSLTLLTHCVKLIEEKGWTIGNIDAMLCLEAPKIKPYIAQMKNNLAEAASMSTEDISIKATTNETMGFIGREEGVVAYAVCLIEKKV